MVTKTTPCPVCGYNAKLFAGSYCARCGTDRTRIKKKYTMADLRAKCKKLHIELDAEPYHAYALYAPKGQRFSATGTHVLVSNHNGVKEWKIEAINRLMEDLTYGLEKCPKNCECREDD
jgi:hypothetical protein